MCELPSQDLIGWHAGEAESIAQRIDVQHRAAFDDWNQSACRDVVDGCASTLDILGRVERQSGIDEVDHVVANSPALLRARLVGRDIQALVHLARVRDDDLATDFERELESQRGLADAGRPDDHGHAKRLNQ